MKWLGEPAYSWEARKIQWFQRCAVSVNAYADASARVMALTRCRKSQGVIVYSAYVRQGQHTGEILWDLCDVSEITGNASLRGS